MHPSSPHMMAVANSLWPFSYQLKSYDMALHPAFLHTAYRGLPTLPYSQGCESVQPHTSSPSPPQKSTDKFSIDAILNKDKDKSDTSRELRVNVEPVHEQKSYTDFVKYTKEDDMITRRHQRLLEVTHPYLGQTGSLHEKDFLQKHLQTTYKQLTETVRTQEKDKKTSQCSDSWSGKSGKGKRVRTIFTPEQLERMEAEFERQQYMVGTERYYLASSLNLTEAQVKVWFQNRRIKWRKQHLEQQQAKLKSLNIYRQSESNSESDSEDDVTSANRTAIMEREHGSIMDPFQSPKESRGTQ